MAAELGVPRYATPFTAGLIAGKLEEEGLSGKVKLNIIKRGGSVDLAPFRVTYVPLAHSIPEGNGVLIETPYGKIFHTGDWKIDETPVLGHPASAETLSKIGDEGILALVCDSTNVFQETASGSEESVAAGLAAEIGKAKGRVLVTTFASNAARLATIGRVAAEAGRTVCVAGRSLDRILKVAKATGYLLDFPEVVRFDEAMRLPKGDVLIVATGGQGEPRAALGRIAGGGHEIKMGEGDTVIFSSKQIPGNELAIGRIMNQLSELGVLTVTERQAHVHVSGHPGRPELAKMFEWMRPEILVPVHGEPRHLAEHARWGLANGIPKAIKQENGDVIRLSPNGPKKIGTERVGRLVLDGDVILPADGTTINTRRRLSRDGLMTVALPVGQGRKLAGRPLIRAFGVPVEADLEDFIADATDAATRAWEPGKDPVKTLEAVRLAVRRCATLWTGKKPTIDVSLVELN